MGLSVIGAGFGRTGTDSMRLALNMLGFGPCHHMREVMANPEQLRLWRWAARGDPPDWEEAFAGYRSALDWPAAFYWRELSRHYPDARILLTLRSAESWYESMAQTIFPVIKSSTEPDSLGVRLIGERVFGNRIDDRAHAIAVYEKNNADVREAFGPDRLLVHQLGDGWEPLCAFLGTPIPEAPYPRVNSPTEFKAQIPDTNGAAER
jgi:hypothetical protein